MRITEYYAARRNSIDVVAEDLDRTRRDEQVVSIDFDEPDVFELPDVEVVDGELTTAVLPIQENEFRCGRCFLVRHRSQLSAQPVGNPICDDCV